MALNSYDIGAGLKDVNILLKEGKYLMAQVKDYGPLWKWLISSYFVTYLIQITK